ncbi:hypothetical protein [Bacillus wiedmannii]|uniref:hypothetical protein n=1 Tax=Bacillus wiedmannii TaxID=1890302 RepID=UPI000BFC8F39|nr:hypothetical protein [Bacillus wiedmannii]PHA62860.1 hypothetical protein COE75_16610 [Bacillus wiedmannii]
MALQCTYFDVTSGVGTHDGSLCMSKDSSNIYFTLGAKAIGSWGYDGYATVRVAVKDPDGSWREFASKRVRVTSPANGTFTNVAAFGKKMYMSVGFDYGGFGMMEFVR